ncbi:MAG: alanine dehydrogenase [Nitrospinae bacterium]|nr:alanine dehydrogenase [Nitrospinota bacterium]
MIVGVPKEIKSDEYRVAVVPSGVRVLTLKGHSVLVEKSAGVGSGFEDDAYLAAGGEIVDSAVELWQRADMVVKVKEPVEQEYKFFREGLLIYAFLHLAADKNLTEELLRKKVTAIAYETIQEADGSLPILVPMSEIAGRMSIQAGAKYLEKPHGGKGLLLGGVPGTERAVVVILGGGVAGKNAARMALGLGARVRVLDVSLTRLRYLDDIFGGAVETIFSDPHTVASSVEGADLVVGSVLIPGARTPRLVTRDMVSRMGNGGVVVDISVDQGGCVETTRPTSHHDPVFLVDGVTHYCVANIPGAVPRTSAPALANASFPYALQIAEGGFKNAAKKNEALRKGINAIDGMLTHQGVADSLGIKFARLEL